VIGLSTSAGDICFDMNGAGRCDGDVDITIRGNRTSDTGFRESGGIDNARCSGGRLVRFIGNYLDAR
jgi:hypothetical protein